MGERIVHAVEVKILVGFEESGTFDEDAAAGPSERVRGSSFHRLIIASDMLAKRSRTREWSGCD